MSSQKPKKILCLPLLHYTLFEPKLPTQNQYSDLLHLKLKRYLEPCLKYLIRLTQAVSTTNLSMSSWVQSQQFGVTLEWIIDNQHCTVPPIMMATIQFLQQPECLETEGIFRSVLVQRTS